MRYKLTMAYDGNNYAGFQSQINALSIQDVLEAALKKIFQHDIRVVMASRTDAKVHAYDQVVHFDEEKMIETYKLKGAINSLLPKDIHIINAEIVSTEFHSRFSVKNKTYKYLINTGEYDVFLNGYAYQCPYPLDLDKMREAAKLFIGTHDFTSFNTSPLAEYPNQTRTIYALSIEKENDLLVIRVKGDGFLKNMVRIIVGTLIDLGRGNKSLAEVEKMFTQPSKDKRRYNICGNGLYLEKIEY